MNEAEELEAKINSINPEYQTLSKRVTELRTIRNTLINQYYLTHTLDETVKRFNSTEHYVKKIVGYTGEFSL